MLAALVVVLVPVEVQLQELVLVAVERWSGHFWLHVASGSEVDLCRVPVVHGREHAAVDRLRVASQFQRQWAVRFRLSRLNLDRWLQLARRAHFRDLVPVFLACDESPNDYRT